MSRRSIRQGTTCRVGAYARVQYRSTITQTLSQYRTAHKSICQYRTPHSTIRYLSTVQRIAPYAIAVPDTA
eukprot:1898013-Rhodomonas_salina.2